MTPTRSIPWLCAALWLSSTASAQDAPADPAAPTAPASPEPTGTAPAAGPPAKAPAAPTEAEAAAQPGEAAPATGTTQTEGAAAAQVGTASAPAAPATGAAAASVAAPTAVGTGPGPVTPPAPAAPAEAAPATAELPEGEAAKVSKRADAGASYTPGKGFTLQTADGDFATTLGFLAQLRYQYVSQLGADRQAAYVPRARLSLSGHVFGEHTLYKVQVGFSARDVSRQPVGVTGDAEPVDAAGDPVDLTASRDVVQQAPLLDLYVDFNQLRDLELRVGQGKVPFSRQRMTSAGKLQLVDRAITDSHFNLDRDVGLTLGSSDLGGLGMLGYRAGIFIGEDRNGSDRTLGSGDEGFIYVARVELMPFGAFDAYSESDHERLLEPHLAFAVAYALVQGDATSPLARRDLSSSFGSLSDDAVVDYNSHNFTADAVFKMAGFSAQTAFHLRKVEGNLFIAPDAPAPRNGIGFMLSAGYLFAGSPVEAVFSYGTLKGSGDDTALEDLNSFGLGLNYYIARHALKLQADFFHEWGPDDFGGGDDTVRAQLGGTL